MNFSHFCGKSTTRSMCDLCTFLQGILLAHARLFWLLCAAIFYVCLYRFIPVFLLLIFAVFHWLSLQDWLQYSDRHLGQLRRLTKRKAEEFYVEEISEKIYRGLWLLQICAVSGSSHDYTKCHYQLCQLPWQYQGGADWYGADVRCRHRQPAYVCI